MGKADTRTARIKPKHEAGFFRAAASDDQMQAEGAVISKKRGPRSLRNMNGRVPHKRAIAKHPEALIFATARQKSLSGGFTFFMGDERIVRQACDLALQPINKGRRDVFTANGPVAWKRNRATGCFACLWVRRFSSHDCPNSDLARDACRAYRLDAAEVLHQNRQSADT